MPQISTGSAAYPTPPGDPSYRQRVPDSTHLWSHVWQASTSTTQKPRLALMPKHGAETKVGYFQITIRSQQQILRFQIPMCDTFRVNEFLLRQRGKISNSQYPRASVQSKISPSPPARPHPVLASVWRTAEVVPRLTNLVEQISSYRQLEQNIQTRHISLPFPISVYYLRVQEFQDVRMFQRFMYLNLFLQLFGVGRAVAKGRGDEQIDDFTSGDFGVIVIDCSKDSRRQSSRRSAATSGPKRYVASTHFENPPPPISSPIRYPWTTG